uniref:MULE transposase domain-containing protein n=2 Tax=Meloidogyne TaxID=189290 RepID=A0A6V7WVX3_MELEN|nr:unnamed protein product [Meloidogyne enterolobii]CAD2191220.1 unnamed protein product [Meloidogyne enterolobii]
MYNGILSEKNREKFSHDGYIYVMDKPSADGEIRAAAQIRAAAVQNLPLAIMGQMPSTSASRKQVQRQRRKENNALASPPTRAEIVFTEQYMNREFNGRQERFLLADSGGEERILIFGSEASAGWSNQMEHVFMDGTFSVCPSLFYQLFIILSKRGGFVFPVLFCLLPDKTEQTYTRLFNLIKELWPLFNPTSISCDFERAIHNSIRTCFPESSIFCCFFHLRQNLRKHISQSNLLNLYNNDPDFALKCKMIIALAFVPENDVINALNLLENDLDDRFEPLISWFVSSYIGRIRGNGTRANPIFPIALWNVHTRTIQNIHRTNNYSEACNRKIKRALGMSHPSLWLFLHSLKKFLALVDTDIELHVAGHEPPRKRAKYMECDDRILRICNNYDLDTVLDFLRGISHNFNID